MAKGTALELLLQAIGRCVADKPEKLGRPLADSLDGNKRMRVGVEQAAQRLEFPEQFLCQRFGVAPRGYVGEEEFDDFVVGKRGNSRFVVPRPQPGMVALTVCDSHERMFPATIRW